MKKRIYSVLVETVPVYFVRLRDCFPEEFLILTAWP